MLWARVIGNGFHYYLESVWELRMRASFAAATAVGGTVAIGAAGCTQQESSQPDHGAANVVASTDVWGSVAGAVAGDHAAVTSIMSGTVADPHSFEASPADTAAITDASLVVFNGGDYDHWVDACARRPPRRADRRRLRAAAQCPRARQRTRLLRPGDRQGRRRTGRRPAVGDRLRPGRHLPCQRRGIRQPRPTRS